MHNTDVNEQLHPVPLPIFLLLFTRKARKFAKDYDKPAGSSNKSQNIKRTGCPRSEQDTQAEPDVVLSLNIDSQSLCPVRRITIVTGDVEAPILL